MRIEKVDCGRVQVVSQPELSDASSFPRLPELPLASQEQDRCRVETVTSSRCGANIMTVERPITAPPNTKILDTFKYRLYRGASPGINPVSAF
jgi:hypothetical protein